MFTAAKRDLVELIDLVRKIAQYDATLAARPDIKPEDSSAHKRRAWEARQLALMEKYELLGTQR